jgi:hypothetical protein
MLACVFLISYSGTVEHWNRGLLAFSMVGFICSVTISAALFLFYISSRQKVKDVVNLQGVTTSRFKADKVNESNPPKTE